MKAFGKLFALIFVAALLVLGAGHGFATEEEESTLDLTNAPATVEEVEEVSVPEEGSVATVEGEHDHLWTPPSFLDDGLVPQSGGGCGACNCNGDDDCKEICGRPAVCQPRICPCATCSGSCLC